MSAVESTNVSEHIDNILGNVRSNKAKTTNDVEVGRQQLEIAAEQVSSMNTLIAMLEIVKEKGLQGEISERVVRNAAAEAEVANSPSAPAAPAEG